MGFLESGCEALTVFVPSFPLLLVFATGVMLGHS